MHISRGGGGGGGGGGGYPCWSKLNPIANDGRKEVFRLFKKHTIKNVNTNAAIVYKVNLF